MATQFLATNKNYKRLFAESLDSSASHETYQGMVEYVSSATSYLGQILYCDETDKLYRIGKDIYGDKELKNDIMPGDIVLTPEQVLTVIYNYGEHFRGNLKEALDYLFERILTEVELTPEMILQLEYKYKENAEVSTIGEALNYLMETMQTAIKPPEPPGITAEQVLYVVYNYPEILSEPNNTIKGALDYLMRKSIEKIQLQPEDVLNIIYTNDNYPDIKNLQNALDYILDVITDGMGLTAEEVWNLTYNNINNTNVTSLKEALDYLIDKSSEELIIEPDKILNCIYTNSNYTGDFDSLGEALDYIFYRLSQGASGLTPSDVWNLYYTHNSAYGVSTLKGALDHLMNRKTGINLNQVMDAPYTHEKAPEVENLEGALNYLMGKESKEFTEEDVLNTKYTYETAEEVTNIQQGLNFLFSKIDEIMYKPIQISSFNISKSQAEFGETVSEVTLTWSTSKSPISIELNGVSLNNDVKTASFNNITDNRTFTLKVSDGKTIVSRNASITFMNAKYYGVYTGTTATANIISGFTKVLTTSKNGSWTVNAGSREYIYFAIPSRFGEPSFYVGGFLGGFTKIDTINFTNKFNYTEEYCIYRSENHSLGLTTVDIK